MLYFWNNQPLVNFFPLEGIFQKYTYKLIWVILLKFSASDQFFSSRRNISKVPIKIFWIILLKNYSKTSVLVAFASPPPSAGNFTLCFLFAIWTMVRYSEEYLRYSEEYIRYSEMYIFFKYNYIIKMICHFSLKFSMFSAVFFGIF